MSWPPISKQSKIQWAQLGRLSLIYIGERVAGASTARCVLHEDGTFHQILDVAERRIRRALGERRPLGRSELAFKTIA